MKPVFPYQTFIGIVELEVVAVTVDGIELPYSKISKLDQAVALHQIGRDEWEIASLRLRATLPDQEIAAGPWTDLVCLAVLAEKATNARHTARLKRADDGRWQGAIDLVRSRHLNRAELSLTVVGTVSGVAGRAVGTTERDWYVDLNRDVPVRQQEIPIVQTDFREGDPDWLRSFKESLWVVETTGDTPVVYLNTTAVEGLLDVVDGTGGTAAEKVVREMTASQIAQDAWTAMFHTAISDLDTDEDDTPVMPAGWREQVLRMMLPDVLPERQLTDALFNINERRTKGYGWPELQTRIQYAAGKRSQVTKKLTNAMRSLDRAEEGRKP
ncbi:hypothetical protein [Crossiella cryophila]|uniref:Uncharacterized protein n=1 Tax=Crossiella cryophila TaxID=43355 RepID=A0A7W7FS89_9PSEU|nr:hypothetical protein [Crossiella cryophila]MBB4675907.1 hypothetical protein [Crossiella cryophila]